MRNERQHDRDEHRQGSRGVYHAEIEEAEHARGRRADQIHFLAADTVGDMARQRDGDERDDGGRQHRAQNKVARHMQRADRISEDERSEDVERRLLRQPQQSRQNDLFRLLSDNLDDRRLLDLVVVQKRLKHRRFENSEAHPQADANQNDRQCEGNAPAPDGELITRQLAEREHREIRQEQTAPARRIAARTPPSRAGRGDATIPSPAERTHPIRRAFMLERGIAVRQGIRFLRTELPTVLATRTDALSPRMLRVIEELAGDWRRLDQRIDGLSGEIEALARQDQACSRLMTVPGIGPIISSAMVAAIGTGDVFSKGRDFGAWLGLVPKQISTGDRTILGKISRRGNRYLRVLFVQAAWVVLVRIKNWERYGLKSWIEAAKRRLHHNVLAIALANKLARIAWAVLAKGRAFELTRTDDAGVRPA